LSEIEVNAEDLQAVIMELQAENSNLKLMKSALSRKVKEQTGQIADLQPKLSEPEDIDLVELKFDS
jgi:predicted nuclease with TOPRIM domain